MKRHVAALLAIALFLASATPSGVPERMELGSGSAPIVLRDGASQVQAHRGAPHVESKGAEGSQPGVSVTMGGTPPRTAGEPIVAPSGEPVLANHNGRYGTWAYASASHGSRYLAIPEGRGWIVEVCGPLDCLERVSTDAGPELWLQRAGRIGDLSSVDFRVVCGPTSAGLCRGGSYTILGAADQSGDDPAPHPADDRMRAEDSVTAPPTDVDR